SSVRGTRCLRCSVCLERLAQVVKCCVILISRPEVASSVHEFTMYVSFPSSPEAIVNRHNSCAPRLAFKSYYSIVKFAASKLNNFRTLHVSSFLLFPDTQFPHLFGCTLPAIAGITPFLRRNQQISCLKVNPCVGLLDFRAGSALRIVSPIPPIHMPKLQHFTGPDIIAFAVVPGSLTSRATIYGETTWAMSFSDTIAALARSNVDITILSIVISTWDCGLLSAIANHISRLQEFIVYIGSGAYGQGKESLFILELLPPASFDCDLDKECYILCRWGEIAPALIFVVLPSKTNWMRFNGLRLPYSNNRGRVGVGTSDLKWLIRAAVTLPTLPPEYLTFAEELAGEDGILALKKAIENDGVLPDFVFTDEGLQLLFPPKVRIVFLDLLVQFLPPTINDVVLIYSLGGPFGTDTAFLHILLMVRELQRIQCSFTYVVDLTPPALRIAQALHQHRT
ncbi:hypothetical protein B0H17DRAFT_1270914, partial [Mycena rosella]